MNVCECSGVYDGVEQWCKYCGQGRPVVQHAFTYSYTEGHRKQTPLRVVVVSCEVVSVSDTKLHNKQSKRLSDSGFRQLYVHHKTRWLKVNLLQSQGSWNWGYSVVTKGSFIECRFCRPKFDRKQIETSWNKDVPRYHGRFKFIFITYTYKTHLYYIYL